MNLDDAVHWDVAAYALGALDLRETLEFEEHLAGCSSCAEELAALLPTVALLSEVDIDAFEVAEQQALRDEGLWRLVATERARASRRRALTLAAGVVVCALAAAGSAIAGAALAGGDPPPAAAPGATTTTAPGPTASPDWGPPDLDGTPLPDDERFSATDNTTGVEADLVLTGRAWGTQVSFTLSALTGPRTCRLLVVRSDGTAEVAGTWQVPEAGYGTAAQPAPLRLQISTSVERSTIDRIQVQSLAEDGEITTLVTVPLSR